MIDLLIQGRLPSSLTPAEIRHTVEDVFRSLKKPQKGALSVNYVSNVKIQALNRKWRKKNTPTDVLSFAPAAMVPGKIDEIGDLFLSPSYIRQSAMNQSVDLHEEHLRVLIHGVLHLFGYDHMSPADEAKMFPIQERLVKKHVQRRRRL